MGCAELVYAETSASIAGDRRISLSGRAHSFGGTGIASGMSTARMSGGGRGRVRARDTSLLDAALDGVFTVPGDGCIDSSAVLTELAAADYNGWLVVEAERDPAKAPPLAYARLGFAHLRAAAARAGLAREEQ
jgi:hypothetical protein